MPRTLSRAGFAAVLSASLLTVGQARAINIVLDYTYDTQDFFGSGNPDGAAAGAQAKVALEAAATYFSDLLTDSFSEIVNPPQYNSQAFDGQVTWAWNRTVTNPGTGSSLNITGPAAADEYRIYAGGRGLAGTTLGQGGPGGFGWSSNPSGGFSSQEIDEIQVITDAFSLAVEERGDAAGGFSSWGGAITFDNDGSADWHYDHTAAPTGSDDDFFSIALHELGHAVGLGTSSEWNALISGGNFTGSNAVASFGGPVPADTGHFDEDVMSVIRGTTTAQEAAMDPNITNGTRKLFTELDVAALADIGWEIAPLVPVGLVGDYNSDGFVSQGDLDLVLLNWGDGVAPAGFNEGNLDGGGPFDGLISQNELDGVLLNWGNGTPPLLAVPEPGSGLALLAGAAAFGRRRRR